MFGSKRSQGIESRRFAKSKELFKSDGSVDQNAPSSELVREANGLPLLHSNKDSVPSSEKEKARFFKVKHKEALDRAVMRGLTRQEAELRADAFVATLKKGHVRNEKAPARAEQIHTELLRRVFDIDELNDDEYENFYTSIEKYGGSSPIHALRLSKGVLNLSLSQNGESVGSRIHEVFGAIGRHVDHRFTPDSESDMAPRTLAEHKNAMLMYRLRQAAGEKRMLRDFDAGNRELSRTYSGLFYASGLPYPSVRLVSEPTEIGKRLQLSQKRASAMQVVVTQAGRSAFETAQTHMPDKQAVRRATAVTALTAGLGVPTLFNVAAAESIETPPIQQMSEELKNDFRVDWLGDSNNESFTALVIPEFIEAITPTQEKTIFDQVVPYEEPKNIEPAHKSEAINAPDVNTEKNNQITQILIDKGGSIGRCGHIIRFAVNELGVSWEEAVGAAGNFMQESGCNPTAEQDKNKRPGVLAKGFAQWDGGRRDRLYEFADSRDVDWRELDLQLAFWKAELEGGERGAFKAWKGTDSLREAVDVFEKKYERAGKPNMANRYEYADEIWSELKDAMDVVNSRSTTTSLAATEPSISSPVVITPSVEVASASAEKAIDVSLFAPVTASWLGGLAIDSTGSDSEQDDSGDVNDTPTSDYQGESKKPHQIEDETVTEVVDVEVKPAPILPVLDFGLGSAALNLVPDLFEQVKAYEAPVPVVQNPESRKNVGPEAVGNDGDECAPGTESLGVRKAGDGKNTELCAIDGLRSSSDESTPGTTYYVEGAEKRAIVSAEFSQNAANMFAAAKADGITLKVTSSFRTYEHQKDLCEGNAGCKKGDHSVVAAPGRSNHNKANAFDFVIENRRNSVSQCVMKGEVCTAPDSKTYQWLVDHAKEFGFKQYHREFWHWDTRD